MYAFKGMLILLGHFLVQVVQCNAVPVYIHVVLHVVIVHLCVGIHMCRYRVCLDLTPIC
jgi:hypothetical protein